MLTEIRLYGHLGERFGKVHHFAVKSAAQAMRALEVNLPGFRRYMLENSEPGYYVIAGKNEGLGVEELLVRRQLPVLKIVPGVQGRKAAGGFQMILGAALMVVGALVVAYAGSYGGYQIGAKIFSVGAAMFLGGLAAYLAPQPKLDESNKAEQAKSYAFDGPENTVAQGGPVPVLYGMLGVGSTVAAMAIYAEDYTSIYGGDGGGPEDDPDAPGFHIYTPALETIHELAEGETEWVVSDLIAAVGGDTSEGNYVYEVVDTQGIFKLDPGTNDSLTTVDPAGTVGFGTWLITIRCTDSKNNVVTKDVIYKVRTEDSDPTGPAGGK